MVRNHLQIDLVKDMALHIADCFLQADVLSLYFLDSCSGGEVVQQSEHLMAGTDAKLPGLAQTLVLTSSKKKRQFVPTLIGSWSQDVGPARAPRDNTGAWRSR